VIMIIVVLMMVLRKGREVLGVPSRARGAVATGMREALQGTDKRSYIIIIRIVPR
jgi:hypothetical protein